MRKCLARPGALQMLIAIVGSLVCSSYPFYLAAQSPGHEFMMLLSGAPALLLMLAGVILYLLFLVGFIRYAASKGYGPLVILILLVANVIGFILLLALPDRSADKTTGA